MKLAFLSILLLALSINLALAEHKKDDAKAPSHAPKASEPNFDIHKACIDATIKDACEATLKSLGGDKENVKASKFADKVVKHAQKEFGETAIKVREQMREDNLDMKIKVALSNCVKFYLDMADGLRGTYLAVKAREYGPETTKFINMAHSFPRMCEEGLHNAGTSGEKLGLYKNFKDLEDIATAMDAVIRYASDNKADDDKH